MIVFLKHCPVFLMIACEGAVSSARRSSRKSQAVVQRFPVRFDEVVSARTRIPAVFKERQGEGGSLVETSIPFSERTHFIRTTVMALRGGWGKARWGCPLCMRRVFTPFCALGSRAFSERRTWRASAEERRLIVNRLAGSRRFLLRRCRTICGVGEEAVPADRGKREGQEHSEELFHVNVLL
jgi:hypothetical protein